MREYANRLAAPICGAIFEWRLTIAGMLRCGEQKLVLNLKQVRTCPAFTLDSDSPSMPESAALYQQPPGPGVRTGKVTIAISTICSSQSCGALLWMTGGTQRHLWDREVWSLNRYMLHTLVIGWRKADVLSLRIILGDVWPAACISANRSSNRKPFRRVQFSFQALPIMSVQFTLKQTSARSDHLHRSHPGVRPRALST